MSTAQSNEHMASSRESRLAYTNRLAELVVHLTDCAPERAIAAVEAQHPVDPVSSDDALAVVARAMCSVRRVDLRDKLDLRDVPSERTEQSRGQ